MIQATEAIFVLDHPQHTPSHLCTVATAQRKLSFFPSLSSPSSPPLPPAHSHDGPEEVVRSEDGRGEDLGVGGEQAGLQLFKLRSEEGAAEGSRGEGGGGMGVHWSGGDLEVGGEYAGL